MEATRQPMAAYYEQRLF